MGEGMAKQKYYFYLIFFREGFRKWVREWFREGFGEWVREWFGEWFREWVRE